MGLSKDEIQQEIIDAWRSYLKQVESSLFQLEQELQKMSANLGNLPDEWLANVDHVVEEISNIIFSVGEPKWADDSDIEMIKNLKKRIYQFYNRLCEVRAGLNGGAY